VWPLQYAVTLPLQQLPDALLSPRFIRCLSSLLASCVLMSSARPLYCTKYGLLSPTLFVLVCLMYFHIESTLRVLGLTVLPAEPRVMSRAQRLSWGWPPLGDSLFSAELLAAFFTFRVFVAT
jgi:hypothetical protein